MPKFPRPFLIQRKVSKLRQDLKQKTQQVREKLLNALEAIFDEATKLAKGETQTIQGKPLTLRQRQAWAKVASYTAQVINSITKTIDEKQIDEDLEYLQKLIQEAEAQTKTQSQTQEQKQEPI